MAKEPWLGDDEQKAWRSYLLMWKLLELHVARHLQREYGLSASDFEILVNLSEAPTPGGCGRSSWGRRPSGRRAGCRTT